MKSQKFENNDVNPYIANYFDKILLHFVCKTKYANIFCIVIALSQFFILFSSKVYTDNNIILINN